MKYAEGLISGPDIPRSNAILQQRIASTIMPAEFGESSTLSLSSRLIGMFPNFLPSIRMKHSLLSLSQGMWSEGPMWMSWSGNLVLSWDCTASVLEIFLDFSRSLSSMFKKSVFPPTFSW